MKILAIEPYYGGSHRSFIDGWIARSSHEWTLLTMPPRMWKWRMRGAAFYFASQVNELFKQGHSWDVVFCCDMLNVAEFLGLVDASLKEIPLVVYFHENQITYPNQIESERDLQFGITNISSCIASDAVWFNSGYHRNEFIAAARKVLRKMPDYRCLEEIDLIDKKSSVEYLGCSATKREVTFSTQGEPLRIVWAARWEHDKNPQDFFEALKLLKNRGTPFELSVIGESFRSCPDCFDWAREYFSDCIFKWGYQESLNDYCEALAWADVFVSTATHEFFGLSAVEASLLGTYPLLPNRLAYPEIFGYKKNANNEKFFYDGSVNDLVKKLIAIANTKEETIGNLHELQNSLEKFIWQNATVRLDGAIGKVSIDC